MKRLFNTPLVQIILSILLIPVSVILITKLLPGTAEHGNTVYEKESRYNYIRIVDDNSIRSLLFTKAPGAKIQSAVHLGLPDELVLEYSKMVFASLAFVEQPQRILVVGLGGGIIPSTFAKQFPDVQIDIVELDGEVVHVAKRFFNFTPSAGTNITVSDGRVYVRQAKQKGLRYDLIILDAFNGSYIPPHLTTREFLKEVLLILNDGGSVVSNIHHRNKLYGYQQRTFADVFPQNYVFEGKHNAIVISTGQKIKLFRQHIEKELSKLQKRFHFSFDPKALSELLIDKPSWNTKGDILTDGYSPVNVLISKE